MKAAEVFHQAVGLLEDSVHQGYFFASPAKVANYQRLWSRDGVICGLAALSLKRKDLIEVFKNSLVALARAQGPQGQIPSNLEFAQDGSVRHVSLGTLAGRVDANTWFIIGVLQYLNQSPECPEKDLLLKASKSSFGLLQAWEYNGRGLIYTPEGGTWADDYLLEGYTFYDQLLRLWASRLIRRQEPEEAALAWGLKGSEEQWVEWLRLNYWPAPETVTLSYHPLAQKTLLADGAEPQHFLAALKPSGYTPQFDLFAHSLALLLRVPESRQLARILRFTKGVGRRGLPGAGQGALLPAFWPVIEENTENWNRLRHLAPLAFKNHPYEYHNGGLWPLLNGWWGVALAEQGEMESAQEVLDSLTDLLASSEAGNQFPEYYNFKHLQALGTANCTWGAAAYIMLFQRLNTGSVGLLL